MEFPNGISEWNFQFFSKVKFLNGCSKRAKRGSVALLSVHPFFSFLKGVPKGSSFDIRRGEIFC